MTYPKPFHSPLAGVAVLVCAVSFPAVAGAHLELTEPPARYDKYTIKSAPCGAGDGERSETVTTYQAGETITVEWDEYVDHPGHFRIAFDEEGADDFESPACESNCSTTEPQVELYNNDTVLLDDIADDDGGTYSADVELPDVTCERCTLQVIQVMYDKPPYEIPGNDIYFTCADLELVGSGGGDTGTESDTGTSDPDGGSNDSADTSGDDDSEQNADTNTASADATDVVSGSGPAAPSESGGDDQGEGCSAVGDGEAPTDAALVVAMLLVLAGGVRLRRRE